MRKHDIKIVHLLLLAAFLVGTTGCSHYMKPARAIPPGDPNTALCKETYLGCRGQCASTKHKDTRLNCADQCENDVDTCLLQSRTVAQ